MRRNCRRTLATSNHVLQSCTMTLKFQPPLQRPDNGVMSMVVFVILLWYAVNGSSAKSVFILIALRPRSPITSQGQFAYYPAEFWTCISYILFRDVNCRKTRAVNSVDSVHQVQLRLVLPFIPATGTTSMKMRQRSDEFSSLQCVFSLRPKKL